MCSLKSFVQRIESSGFYVYGLIQYLYHFEKFQKEGNRVLCHEHTLAPSGEELVPPSTLIAPTLLGGLQRSWRLEEAEPASHGLSWESAPSSRALQGTLPPGTSFLSPAGAFENPAWAVSAWLVMGTLTVPVLHMGEGRPREAVRHLQQPERRSESSHDAVCLLPRPLFPFSLSQR